jgi:hypothetical protein
MDKHVLLAPSLPGFVGDQGQIHLNTFPGPANPVVLLEKIPVRNRRNFLQVFG